MAQWNRFSVATEPTCEPVSVDEVKQHCRITETADDTLLAGYIQSAREHVENLCGRRLIATTIDVYYTGFPAVLWMPFAPLSGVTSVKYQDTENAQQTLSSAVYETGECTGVPVVRPKYGQTWPTTLGHPDDVVLRGVFGYGTRSTLVPRSIRTAIMQLVSHWYESREPIVTGTIAVPIQMMLDSLLASYRITEVA